MAGSCADIVARGLDWCEPLRSATSFRGKTRRGLASLLHLPSPRSWLPPRVGLAIVLLEVVQAARKKHHQEPGLPAGWPGTRGPGRDCHCSDGERRGGGRCRSGEAGRGRAESLTSRRPGVTFPHPARA